MSGLSIGIAGAGLLGRLLAWRLSRAGHRVSCFDPAAGPEPSFDGRQAAAFTAAGMLSPLAELDNSGPGVAALGWRSIDAWRDICAALEQPQLCSVHGSLLLAHRSDLGAAQRVLARIGEGSCGRFQSVHAPQRLDAAALAALEPAVQGPPHAWLLPGEGQIDPVGALLALHAQSMDVRWHWRSEVARVVPGEMALRGGGTQRFDLCFDTRGLGARPAATPKDAGTREGGLVSRLRGVRGETVWLHAPGHGLTRPVRLLHPRHRVYLVPRPDDVVFVGASEVESEDRGPVSLRSAVELMSAAHSVMPALAEARILRLDRNLRPALPDNEPHVEHTEGLVRINGLFRHGWLIAPALVDDALARCQVDGLHAAAHPHAAESAA